MGGGRFLIAGGGGRECAFAARLAEDSKVYAVASHENPQIARYAKESGGAYAVADHNDPGAVLAFAKRHSVDYAFVNADQPLANGVVDALLRGGFRAVGATRAASRLEWDKAYAIEVVQELCPEFAPFHRTVSDSGGIDAALGEFRRMGADAVVKPQGLTGGKGVKVMPVHLPGYPECAEYASSLLAGGSGGRVLLVERLEGIEFTVMGITDGRRLVLAPATYDYPFRCEGDTGAGTGGMGCFTGPGGRLPFLSGGDLEDCRRVMQKVIDEMRSRGHPFGGILNGGFFKTRDGIRFMEFNARFGDPEGINVLSLLRGPFSELLARVWDGGLAGKAVGFDPRASVTKYLVAEEYPDESPEASEFSVDEGAAARTGVATFLASCVGAGGGRYRTLRKSRVAAFGAVSDTVEGASSLVDRAIDSHVKGDLECRRDIGSRESLEKLDGVLRGMDP